LRHFSSRKSSIVCTLEEESLGPKAGSQAHWVDVGVTEDEVETLAREV
jgi:hypothetical protein